MNGTSLPGYLTLVPMLTASCPLLTSGLSLWDSGFWLDGEAGYCLGHAGTSTSLYSCYAVISPDTCSPPGTLTSGTQESLVQAYIREMSTFRQIKEKICRLSPFASY